MKFTLLALGAAALVSAQKTGKTAKTGKSAKGSGSTGGTIQTIGKFTAAHSTDAGLSKHTIYMPQNVPAGTKLPVLIWGNGACSGNGLLFQKSLLNVASHGYFVIAMGLPNGSGSTSSMSANASPLQTEAINFVVKNAGTGKYANVLKDRIVVAGQSCGGLESIRVWDDPRVSAIGVFNSGEFSLNRAPKISKPIFYFLGGSGDVAYPNGERDYKNLMAGTPSWKGNLPLGHMADWSVTTGQGKFNAAEIKWLDWMLKGDESAKAWFVGGGAKADGWAVESKNLEKIKVAPL